jgi:hypothetical protein
MRTITDKHRKRKAGILYDTKLPRFAEAFIGFAPQQCPVMQAGHCLGALALRRGRFFLRMFGVLRLHVV